ncbi:MAG: class II fumarate hydratase [Bacillota bacterium]
MDYRIERDSLGEVKVPDNKYYGAQTQRAYKNFPIGREKIPEEIIYAYAVIKKSAAEANYELGLLDKEKSDYIITAAEEIMTGKLDDNFPLSVWQTGSGTQTNMNVNEVISNRISELAGEEIGSKKPVHPNDHVNMSQSSNDTFPTAMAVAAALKIENDLFAVIENLISTLNGKIEEFKDIVKVGRTHLMDATPIKLSQEFAAFSAQAEQSLSVIKDAVKYIKYLPIGGTAVGTGLNTKADFDRTIIKYINKETELDFKPMSSKSAGIAAHDSFVNLSGALKTFASFLMKLANDIRWLSSGPRCGIGELKIPKNEPGSSIMPGKVNPTQAEALVQVSMQVMANDTAVNFGGGSGNFQLNVCKPLIIYNILQSITLLTDAVESFNIRCLKGIKANNKKIEEYLDQSLMLVTALNPVLGYDKSAEIAGKAFKENMTLKNAAVSLGYLTEEEFERYINPNKMTEPNL